MNSGTRKLIGPFAICAGSILGCSGTHDVVLEEQDQQLHSEEPRKTTAPLQVDDGLLDAPDSEYGQAPGGRRLHRSCVHDIPEGGTLDAVNSLIRDANGNVVKQYGKCRYTERRNVPPGAPGGPSGTPQTPPVPDTAIYQEYSGADAAQAVCGNWGPPYYTARYCPAWYDSFYGSVHVPPNPTEVGQLVYLWSGIIAKTNGAPGGFFPLLQPVLQWGNNGYPNGGGAYWAFSSWYLDGYGTAVRTNVVAIYAGDDLIMNTFVSDNTCTMSGTNCKWRVVAWRNSNSAWSTSLNLAAVPGTFDTVYRAVLEAYGAVASGGSRPGVNPPCNIYPGGGGTTFGSTQAYQPLATPTGYQLVTQSWQAVTHNLTPNCSYGQTAGTGNETYLYFNNL